MKPVLVLALFTLFLPSAFGQSLDVSEMTLGQTLRLDVSGMTPGATVIHAFTLTGVGSGTCIPGTAVCLDILEPVAIIDTLIADAVGEASWTAIMPMMAPAITFHFQALGVDFTGGVLSVVKTNSESRTIRPVSALSDDFAGVAVDSEWRLHNAALMQVGVSGGQLVIEPLQGGGADFWFRDGEGPALLKRLRGDFTVTASLHAEDPASPGMAPPLSYRLGGLIARDPAGVPGARNSVHVALGSGTSGIPLAAEDKSTLQSTSRFSLHPIATPDGELRLRRSGATFTMWHRPFGVVPWTLLATHVRPDLPDELEVGPMAYSSSHPPRIRVRFDSVDFTAP